MEQENSKQFTIIDALDINTVVYLVNENKENQMPKFTIQRLEYEEVIKGNVRQKTFFVDGPITENRDIVIISFQKNKVVVNNGVLEPNQIRIYRKSKDMKYTPVYKEVSVEHEDIEYTHDLKRSISIIDPVTGDELKPEIYLDEKTNKLKGKYNLNPLKSYFAFEIPSNYKSNSK